MDKPIQDVMPKHIGIIMDGNGRWARRRNLPRTRGHYEGLKTAKRIIRAVSNRGIPFITLYAFSTENWRRSRQEISYLMSLIAKYLIREIPFYREHNLKIVHIGDVSQLPQTVVSALQRVSLETAEHTGTTVSLAINYGGRNELLRAVRKWYDQNQQNQSNNTVSVPLSELDEESISRHLDFPEAPEPDLIIRTGGEQRLSNFLLWQSAYTELYFTDILWPDWKTAELDKAIREYNHRVRRFGGEG